MGRLMKAVSRAWFSLFLVVPLMLAACGDKEPEQRAAFSQFLQTRIIDKPGIHVPQLTADEKKSFGDYTTQYAVITDFNAGMSTAATPMGSAMQQASIRDLNDLVKRRDDLTKARAVLTSIRNAIEKQQATADAARGQLKQPDDLKPVYGKAYDRTVTEPAAAFKTVFPLADTALASALDLADYVEQNKAKIDSSGAVLRVSDPKVLAELNKRLQAMAAQAAGLMKAQGDFQKVVTGR
jgi:hypothetical protein